MSRVTHIYTIVINMTTVMDCATPSITEGSLVPLKLFIAYNMEVWDKAIAGINSALQTTADQRLYNGF